MARQVFVGSAFVAQYPTGGGNFWVPLQYLLGLRALGVEAWWLELLWAGADGRHGRDLLTAFRDQVEALGVTPWVTLLYFPTSGPGDAPAPVEHVFGHAPAELTARARDALLLNLANSVPAPRRTGFGRTALLDLDPGPFQLWAREYDLGVGGHDAHLTIGMNLGAPDSPVPLGDVSWSRVWPVVHLDAWPMQRGRGARWTTVTQWWTGQWAHLDREAYDCNKRPGFLEVVDLPARTGLPLELAANLHPGEREDRALLAQHGWCVADPAVVAGTPASFRAYVQASRGELSAAKPAYVKARPGWVSDRTLCYLASGRPCVVQATGAERHLPATPGLRFWRTAGEAAEALRAAEADHAAAARAARALAEEVFSTRVALPPLLRAAGA
jgi:hypothetical protein